MMVNKLLAIGILIAILMLVAPNVYAGESNSKRYIDGHNDGTQAAQTALQNGNAFDSACDPTGVHTTDGQHSTAYCTGWAYGYDNTYHNGTPALVGGVGPTSGNRNTPSLQSQGNTSPCVDVVNCHVTVEQKQNNEPTSNTDNSQGGN